MSAQCKCPECGEIIPCEKVHNGIAYVWHAVHCGWGHEVEPLPPQPDPHCPTCKGTGEYRSDLEIGLVRCGCVPADET